MLKVLTSASRLSAQFSVAPSFRNATQSESPLLRVLNSVNASNRRFFCSEETKNPDTQTETGTGPGAEPESNFNPDDCFRVLVVPLPHKPLFPGFKMPVIVKDSKLLAALSDAHKGKTPFAGAFLVKDERKEDPNVVTGSEADPTVVTGSEAEKSIYELKGKDLLNRLHDIGTLAQITSIQGEEVVLLGDRRIWMKEMVDEEPPTVKVDHLKDHPFSRDDDVMKSTTIEVVSSIRYVLKTTKVWRDYVQAYTQNIFDFNYPKLADFGAAVSNATKADCQAVLEELDVPKRIQLSLETLRREREITKQQELEEGKFDFLPGLSQMSQMSQPPRRR